MKMTLKNTLLITSLLAFIPFANYAQEEETSGDNSSAMDNAELVAEGNKLLASGKFGSAMTVWQKVVASEPNNSNANFKLGLCYNNSLDQKGDALPYFKVAINKMTDKYDFYDKEEKKAPYDAMFFLGETYLSISETDSALDYFIAYQNEFEEDPPIDVDRFVLMCVNARKSKKSPRDVSLVDMGSSLNTEYSESNPVATIDNSIMFFSTRRPRADNSNADVFDEITGKHHEDIYWSNKGEDGTWQDAILFKLSSEESEAPLGLSANGLTFYFKKRVKGVFNLYQSNFVDGVWSNPVKFGSGINSKFDETGMSISGDGMYMYFISNRDGDEECVF